METDPYRLTTRPVAKGTIAVGPLFLLCWIAFLSALYTDDDDLITPLLLYGGTLFALAIWVYAVYDYLYPTLYIVRITPDTLAGRKISRKPPFLEVERTESFCFRRCNVQRIFRERRPFRRFELPEYRIVVYTTDGSRHTIHLLYVPDSRRQLVTNAIDRLWGDSYYGGIEPEHHDRETTEQCG